MSHVTIYTCDMNASILPKIYLIYYTPANKISYSSIKYIMICYYYKTIINFFVEVEIFLVYFIYLFL